MNEKTKTLPLGQEGRSPGRLLLVATACVLILIIAGLLLKSFIFSSGDQKNVLLIVVDSLRTDHLGCYGFERPTSPNIDKLAASGTLFIDFSTVVPSTLASFTTLFTSHYPKDHGAFRNSFPPFDDLPTLAEAFRDAGYETAAFVSSYCVHSDFGVDRGFDHFDDSLTQVTILPDNNLMRQAGEVTGSFIQWLNRREDKPFFAVVHYFDPHYPYRPPDRFAKMFQTTRPAIRKATMHDIGKAQSQLNEAKGRPGDFEKNLHDLYCAEIRYMDEEVGRLINRVRRVAKDGEIGEPVIVFTADHGETFWEHADYFNHGYSVFETAISIPLIVSSPGFVPVGKKKVCGFSNIDLGPTLCGLAGVEAPPEFEGRSFHALVAGSGEVEPPEFRFAESTKPYPAEEGAVRPNYNKAKMVRQGAWKYVELPCMGDWHGLYNVNDDPGEITNLAGDEELGQIMKSLKERLRRWADDFDAGRKRGGPVDPDVIEKLKGLGYGGE